MSDISQLTALQATPTTPSTSSSATGSINQLSNPQLFLQLLIAELQNQDPTNPTNPSTIMQQTSELSQMQAVNTMTTAVTGEQTATQDTEAASLIGKTITATVSGTPITGAVTDVQLDSSGTPSLMVNGTAVPLASITDISGGASSS